MAVLIGQIPIDLVEVNAADPAGWKLRDAFFEEFRELASKLLSLGKSAMLQ